MTQGIFLWCSLTLSSRGELFLLVESTKLAKGVLGYVHATVFPCGNSAESVSKIRTFRVGFRRGL